MTPALATLTWIKKPGANDGIFRHYTYRSDPPGPAVGWHTIYAWCFGFGQWTTRIEFWAVTSRK